MALRDKLLSTGNVYLMEAVAGTQHTVCTAAATPGK